MDCGVDTTFATGNSHYYQVRDEVWLAAVPTRACTLCLEARFGRSLASAGFTSTPFEIMARLSGGDELAKASLEARGANVTLPAAE